MQNIKRIYCDFDGTITKKDAVNTFFEMYADPQWVDSEKLWVEGKITSRENAIAQVAMLPKLTKTQVNDFIDSIEIDDYFLEFLDFINSKGIEFTILSDGFDLFIQQVLAKHNIKNVNYFANHLIHTQSGNFQIDFPYYNKKCSIGAGMCKCNQIKDEEFCYIGDGTSDLCVAEKASLLFATKSLRKHCVTKDLDFVPFNSFRDIIEHVEGFYGEKYGSFKCK